MTTSSRISPTTVAPLAAVAPERRGGIAGRFCRGCGEYFPAHRAAHAGRPLFGKDHVSAPCAHEGESFAAGASWWEPAVRVLPPPAPAAAAPTA